MSNNNSIAIRLTKISKRYTIHHEKPTLVERLAKGKNEEFWALNDINLTIKKGERVGIIGPNGSGKTTLLKIIAGITTPTSGTVETHEKIVSLIEVESGFHSDLTGEQNIYLNGMLLGMNKKEITKNLDRIIDFADIGQFIDAPLYTYSSGMKLRLGFAVAVHAQPDVLILDEGLSAGDLVFQKKAQQKVEEFFQRKKTIILVSHMLLLIKHMCKRIIILNRGQIIKNGSLDLLDQYSSGSL